MAIAFTNLTSGSSTISASSDTTASITPASNNLILLVVASRTAITIDPNQPTATGNGLTWVAIGSVVYDNTSSSRRRLTLFRAMGASPSTGAITIDYGGQLQTTVLWAVQQGSGTDTTGTNGSGAVVQAVTNSDPTATATSLTVTLAAFSSVNNATYGVFANGDGSATRTLGAGFTTLSDLADALNDIRLSDEYTTANDTTVDMSWTSASEVGGIALEIKAAVVTGSQASQRMMMGMGN